MPLQEFLDADPWKSMDIFDPNGKRVFRATTSGRVGKQGGAELFLESAEPNFDQLSLAAFLERFPAGDYRIEGRGLNGERIVGNAKFTHHIPLGPVLVSPVEDAMVDPNNAMVVWDAVPAPNGSPIQVEDRYVNPAVAPKYLQQDFTRITPNQYLMSVAPHWRAEYAVEAAAADRRTAKLLRILAGAPCLDLTRHTWSRKRPASFARLTHPGERHRFTGQV